MTKKFISIVPFWPVALADSENYFLSPSIVAKKQGYDVSIFVVSPSTKQQESVYKGIPVRFFSSVWELYKNLPTRAIIHCQTSCRYAFLILGLLFFKKRACQIVWTPHTSFGYGFPSKLPFNFFKVFSFMLKRLNRIIAITKYEEEYLQTLGYKNITYIPLVSNKSGLDLEEIRAKEQVFNLLFVGGDRPIKGLVNVLKAVSVLRKLNIDVKLRVLGTINPSFMKKYSNLILPNIEFLGHIKHRSPLFLNILRQSDCYINNSLYEGHPLAVDEAVEFGLFLCLSDLPTFRRTFGASALFHNPNCYSELVKSIIFYFYNREIGRRHRKDNEEIIKDFSYSHFEARFKRVLKDLESVFLYITS